MVVTEPDWEMLTVPDWMLAPKGAAMSAPPQDTAPSKKAARKAWCRGRNAPTAAATPEDTKEPPPPWLDAVSCTAIHWPVLLLNTVLYILFMT
jgi:hypothetical protein